MSADRLWRALLPVLAVAVAVLAGIGTAGSFGEAGDGGEQADVRTVLDSINSELKQGLESGFPDQLASYYAPQAVYQPAMQPPVQGREAIIAHLRTTSTSIETVEFRNRSVEVLGQDRAAEHGTIVYHFSGGAGAVNTGVKASYTFLFERGEDGWKMVRDIRSAHTSPGGA